LIFELRRQGTEMSKPVRIAIGIVITGLVLTAAQLAAKDCRLAPYVYDNCLWTKVRTHLGLPDSRFLRMGLLESVGIVLCLILYFTHRFVFPRKVGTAASAPAGSQSLEPPTQ
jgi:hypothetical protein